MTQNNKPEWFDITDADEKPALRKVSKSLPVSAVLVAALILGAGVVTAQSQNETSSSVTTAAPGVSSAVESAPIAPDAAVVAGVVATNKLANPSIAKLPTGGDDDDDEDDEGDDD
jgi:hypothetical protein